MKWLCYLPSFPLRGGRALNAVNSLLRWIYETARSTGMQARQGQAQQQPQQQQWPQQQRPQGATATPGEGKEREETTEPLQLENDSHLTLTFLLNDICLGSALT
eukprot:TRINITY_DN12063_c1_g1_i1.p1 TRINITY_DN12063_c1_g1~~TRINITY_DN12063_c1_g1_i1.p1  ORF type:complete len:104 (-),score=12.56 TRINITY_DN12063_c1_g1_i1:63-374(-)